MVLNPLEPSFSGTRPLVGDGYIDDSAISPLTRDVECLDEEWIKK
jgi:hypothetical protein